MEDTGRFSCDESNPTHINYDELTELFKSEEIFL